MNVVRNNFPYVSSFIENYLDVFAIAEARLGSFFPEGLFLLKGMKKPYRLDFSSKKDDLLTFVNEDTPTEHLQY